MHRRGHVGIALLAYAPAGYILLEANQPAIALLGAIAVMLIEPLPDNDLWIPWLSHRGVSHSLFCALLVGVVLGALDWLAGERLLAGVATTLSSADTGNVGFFAGVLDWLAARVRSLDSDLLGAFGFVAVCAGIIVHLLGDIITISGIRPLLPLSRRRVSLSGLRTDSTLANSAFLALGVLAIALVLFATAPSVGAPGGNVSAVVAAQETPENATLELGNHTTNGSITVVDSVRLPEGGFVVIHGERYLEGVGGPAALAVSGPLPPGTHRNVTVDLTNAVPGSAENAKRLNESIRIAAVAYRDTNGNETFDYYRDGSDADAPYGSDIRSVADAGFLTVEESRADVYDDQSAIPSIAVSNQSVEDDAVTIDAATLPRGGFIAIHDRTYLPPDSRPVSSTVGVTNYLDPGEYENVTVPLLAGALNRSQTIVAVPHHDTNANRTFDFVLSRAREDIGYVRDSEIVDAQAFASVPGAPATTSTGVRGTATTPEPTTPPTATAISIGLNNNGSAITPTAGPTDATTEPTPSPSASEANGVSTTTDTSTSAGSDPFAGLPLGLSPMDLLVIALVVAIGGVLAVRS